MTKFDEIITKYPEEIKEILIHSPSFAWNKILNRPVLCGDFDCFNCLFEQNCSTVCKRDFLNSIINDTEISENRNKDGEITW